LGAGRPFCTCPRQDSNLRTTLRRRVLYPLSYGGSDLRLEHPTTTEGYHRLSMPPSKKRILICDDDPAILRVLQVNLEIEGYEVLAAQNGEDAVKVALAERPDLVILDIMMPRLDGYQACERLKANDDTRDIPVVFLSAKAQQSDIQRGKDYGVADYLTKPFDPMDLLDVVERLLV
jgi:CheY-like chemotaxis protein